MSVLLSTMMAHHHHMGRICMVVEQCRVDGNFNDEHTHHHENEQDGCRVHQMHYFVTNAKVVKSIEQHIFDGTLLFCSVPSVFSFVPSVAVVITKWQEKAAQLPDGLLADISRRGPPSAYFIMCV